MEPLKAFVARARRGPVFRALLVYGAASWATLQAVDMIAGFTPLPEWGPGLALLLLLIGLPVVLATALAQGRDGPAGETVAPGGGGEASGAPAGATGEAPEESGGDVAEQVAVPSAQVRRLFTWENTVRGGVAASLLWAAAATIWVVFVAGRAEHGPVSSVAVLPFSDLSDTQDQEYFSDGLTEEILNGLAAFPDLRVPARTSSFAFKGRNEDIRTIAQTLRVETILEGSVRKQGTQVRVTAQLIDAETGYHLWSQTFDGSLADPFGLQERVSRAVVAAMRGAEGVEDGGEPEEQGRRTPGTPVRSGTGEAFDLYLRGRAQWHTRTPESMQEAQRLFEAARTADPRFARAYVGMADTYNLMALNLYGRPSDLYPLGLAAARRARELEPTLAGAYAAEALALFQHDRDWIGAEQAFRRALELDPNSVEAHYFFSMFLSAMGRREDALFEARQAVSRDPLSGPVNLGPGMALMHDGRYPEAAREFERGVAAVPGYFFIHSWLGLALALVGEAERAIASAREGIRLNPDAGLAELFYAEVLALVGRTDEARVVADDLAERFDDRPVSAAYLARVYAILGELDTAVRWVRRALEDGEGQVTQIGGRGFTPLRQSPAFKELLSELGVPTS